MLNANANAERSFARPARAEAPADDPEAPKLPVLGKSLFFRGELTAEEDLILQGRVEGSIRHARSLIIGTEGSVLGDVYASNLTVEGLVEGDLHCTEAVIVRATAQVRGNIYAPRVGIMEGATFNGRIEMDTSPAAMQARQAGGQQRQQAASPQTRSGNAPASAAAARPANSTAGQPAASQTPSASTPAASLSNTAVDHMLSSQGANKK